MNTLLALMMFAGAIQAPMNHHDAALMQFAQEILEVAGTNDDHESAAFIVRSPDGALSLTHWPNRRRFREAQWTGAVPAGVIAVIHNHPASRPFPSADDQDVAARMGLPVYVVSRGALCRADAAGSVHCARRVPWTSFRGAPVTAVEWVERLSAYS